MITKKGQELCLSPLLERIAKQTAALAGKRKPRPKRGEEKALPLEMVEISGIEPLTS